MNNEYTHEYFASPLAPLAAAAELSAILVSADGQHPLGTPTITVLIYLASLGSVRAGTHGAVKAASKHLNILIPGGTSVRVAPGSLWLPQRSKPQLRPEAQRCPHDSTDFTCQHPCLRSHPCLTSAGQLAHQAWLEPAHT